jgi:predicted nucleic acid-binding protein
VTRFVVDCGVVLLLAAGELESAPEHELLAPTLVRSQALSALYDAVARGELEREVALERLGRVGRMKMRLLGDAVLRRKAWQVAEELGWSDTYAAEYVALTQLQADALVTFDERLAHEVAGLVRVAPIDELGR